MTEIDISLDDFDAWLTEAELTLINLDDLDLVLEGQEAALTAEAAELYEALRAAGLDSDEALEQALASRGEPVLAEAAAAQALPTSAAPPVHRMGRMV